MTHARTGERRCACGGTVGPSGECAACRAKRLARERSVAPPIVHQVLNSPGRPLEPPTRRSMEAQFGHDFGAVRVHDDSRAAASAGAVGAAAYTVGRDVVFGPGRYRPATPAGRSLLAHELAHVVQQHGAAEPRRPVPIGAPNAPEEREAARVAGGRTRRPEPAGGAPVLRRQLLPARFSPFGPPPDWDPMGIERARRMLRGLLDPILGPASAANPLAYKCITDLEPDMYHATFGAAHAGGEGGFRREYWERTKAPMTSNVWDAFGHCYMGCRAARDCGVGAAAVSSEVHEALREYTPYGGPHDSYAQDRANERIGRGFGTSGQNCYSACRDAALGIGPPVLDLSAPKATTWYGPNRVPEEFKQGRTTPPGPTPTLPTYTPPDEGWQ
jgi:hypothetical protein